MNIAVLLLAANLYHDISRYSRRVQYSLDDVFYRSTRRCIL